MSGFQTLGDFLGSFGAASLEPANELVEAGRGDEHIDDFETELLGTLLDASGTLQVDLKNGGDAFGEVFLNGLEGRAVAGQAVDRGGFEKIAGLFLVGELLVVEEPVVDTIDLAGPRLAGPVRTTRRLRGVPSSSGVAAGSAGVCCSDAVMVPIPSFSLSSPSFMAS